MCRGSDGLVVVGWPHLALEVGVVRETHVDDLEEKSPDQVWQHRPTGLPNEKGI